LDGIHLEPLQGAATAAESLSGPVASASTACREFVTALRKPVTSRSYSRTPSPRRGEREPDLEVAQPARSDNVTASASSAPTLVRNDFRTPTRADELRRNTVPRA